MYTIEHYIYTPAYLIILLIAKGACAATNPAYSVRPPSAASELPFKWPFAGGPMIAHF